MTDSMSMFLPFWWLWLVPGIQLCHSLSEGCLLPNTSCSHGYEPLRRHKCFTFLNISMGWHLGVTANFWLVRLYVNTSVIQSIHHQHKFSKEFHIVVWADWRNIRTQDIISFKSSQVASHQQSNRYFSQSLTCPSDRLNLSLEEITVSREKGTRNCKKLTSWCCRGRQWYLQWDRTLMRSPWPPAKQMNRAYNAQTTWQR